MGSETEKMVCFTPLKIYTSEHTHELCEKYGRDTATI
jgi:hypothetical protein